MKSELNPTTTTPDTANTDNTRLSLLNTHCGRSLAYTSFKTAARHMGAPFSCDCDLERFEAAAALFLNADVNAFALDLTFASKEAFSWTWLGALLSAGRLNWWKDADSARVVELPPVAAYGDYFPDEVRDPCDEGGDL